MLLGLGAVACWLALYVNLSRMARWLTYTLLGLPPATHVSSAVEFFIFEVPKVLLLLAAVVFAVGIVRSYFTPERTRRILAGTSESVGLVLAALLGVVTPFCSCSAVPLFLGFVTAGVPLGVTFSFLISAPMVNEVALVLLFGLFGWKVAAIYMATGLLIAMASGWMIGRLGMEDQLESWVRKVRSGVSGEPDVALGWRDRIRFGFDALRDIVGKVWLYVVAGIAVGAAIHGWVPTNFMASFMGKDVWWGVPVVVLIGIPMYSNAAGIIPDSPGAARERRRPRHRSGVHDVGDQHFDAGGDHPPQGSAAQVDRGVCRSRHRRHSSRRIPLQCAPLKGGPG